MKIAVIADYIDDQYAGTYVYAAEFIHALERNNTRHEICYIHRRRNPFFDGLPQIVIPLKVTVPFWASFRNFIWVPWVLKTRRFEIVHELAHIAPFAFLAGELKKVVTIHDLTSVLFPQFHVRGSTLAHRIFLPLVFRRADLIVTDSECTKRDVLTHYSPKGRVESVLLAPRSSVDPIEKESAKERLRSRYGIDRDFILFVGTLEPRKNLGFLLDIFCDLKEKKGFTGMLVLVGKTGWHFQGLQAKLKALEGKWGADIRVTGYVPPEELPFFYSAASAFVYPSFYEGFGLPPLEAMKCGCPVVVADNSSLKEVVEGAGLRLPLGPRQLWMEKVHEILTDDALSLRMVQAGYRQCEKFSWDRHAQQVLSLYEEIAADRHT